jgi:hypothetical protein
MEREFEFIWLVSVAASNARPLQRIDKRQLQAVKVTSRSGLGSSCLVKLFVSWSASDDLAWFLVTRCLREQFSWQRCLRSGLHCFWLSTC